MKGKAPRKCRTNPPTQPHEQGNFLLNAGAMPDKKKKETSIYRASDKERWHLCDSGTSIALQIAIAFAFESLSFLTQCIEVEGAVILARGFLVFAAVPPVALLE